MNGVPELEDIESSLGDLSGKNALVKVDFNVPLQDGKISDDLRIKSALPTIEWLTQRGVNIALCSHLGRPGGKVDQKFSLDPVRIRLKELGVEAELLPNLRFSPGEKTLDESFIDSLVEGKDFFVNDSFGVSHRSEASSIGPSNRLPAAAGLLFIEEVRQLNVLLDSPVEPFVAVLGGLKISDKLPIVKALLNKVDTLLIGGAMAFTFLKAQGINVGASLVEDSMIAECKSLLESSNKIMLPTDFVALEPKGQIGVLDDAKVDEVTNIPDGWEAADIGPETAAKFSEIIQTAGTVFWNGPVGAFEDSRFATGTSVIADAMAESSGFTVVGGGDSAAAIAELGSTENISHISTGGGASLKFIETGDLVALQALREGKLGGS